MASSLTLESFEEVLVDDAGPDISYDEGYAAGLEAGEAAVRNEAELLQSTLVQSVSDIQFTYAEARGRILQSLAPLFETIAEKILPHCVELGFAGELAALLSKAADAQIDQSISLTVSPDQVEAAELATRGLATPVKIKADAGLSPHAAWVSQGLSECRFDADAALEQIQQILGAIENEHERSGSHG